MRKAEEVKGLSCPRCGGTLFTKDGYSKGGKREYKCKNCKRRVTEGTAYLRFNEYNKDIKCPHCGNTKLRKKDFTTAGNRRYYCPSCNKKFVPPNNFACKARELTEEDKRIVKYFRNARVSISDISKYLHKPARRVAAFLKQEGLTTRALHKGKKNSEVKMKRGKYA